ncbi:hypothetical protein AML91_00150, partial [Paenibacillus jilunlii]
ATRLTLTSSVSGAGRCVSDTGIGFPSFSEGGQEQPGNFRFTLGAYPLLQNSERPVMVQYFAVGTVRGHGVIGIGHGDYPAMQGNGRPGQAVAISLVGITFVMGTDTAQGRRHFLVMLNLQQNMFSKDGMTFDLVEFLLRKLLVLEGHALPHKDLAAIMQQGRGAQSI